MSRKGSSRSGAGALSPLTARRSPLVSTELYLDSGTEDFRVEMRPIREDWTRILDGSWYESRTTFSWYNYTPDEQFVSISAQWTGDGRIETTHVGGSSV